MQPDPKIFNFHLTDFSRKTDTFIYNYNKYNNCKAHSEYTKISEVIIMTYLQLVDDNYNAKVQVEIGMFDNETVPSLRYKFGLMDMDDMDSETLKRIFKVAEDHLHGIFVFDKKYDWDCMDYIEDSSEVENPIIIEKYCCSDEDDDKPFIVEFPQVPECRADKYCPRCDHNLFRKCIWE